MVAMAWIDPSCETCMRRDSAARTADSMTPRGRSLRLSGGIAPLAWWLASTSRWRTTCPVAGERPTKPVFRSRVGKRSTTVSSETAVLRPLVAEGTTRGPSNPAMARQCFENRASGSTTRPPPVSFNLRKSSGFARDLRLISLYVRLSAS